MIALPGPKRFAHFVKAIVDREELWGLYDGGWALASTDDGTSVFPMWPAEEYAQLCAENEWRSYEPRSISLAGLLNDLLPKLQRDGVLPGVFMTPTSKSSTLSVEELIAALDAELQKY